jgi:polysaccharide deacetylase family protein (PEP-CTERM system associated)
MSAVATVTHTPSREGVAAATIVNALTIDVEDYFQVSAFAPHIARSEWDVRECRVEQNIDRILALLADANAKATFFTLGWIAERYPQIVRLIAGAGHELASHGFAHQRASEQAPKEFLADIRLAKAILEDIGGCNVAGYRAPSFSIGTSNPWAFDAIAEAGYRYSSSIYPIRHDHYGVPDAPRFAHESRPGLLEIPCPPCGWARSNWPAGGGGYFRLLPYALSRWSIARINAHDRQPAMFYFHPWELDPEQAARGWPRCERRAFATTLNLRRMAPRLTRLLRDFAGIAPTASSCIRRRDGWNSGIRRDRSGHGIGAGSRAAVYARRRRSLGRFRRALRRCDILSPRRLAAHSRRRAAPPVSLPDRGTERRRVRRAAPLRSAQPSLRSCTGVVAALRVRRPCRCRRARRGRVDRCGRRARALT